MDALQPVLCYGVALGCWAVTYVDAVGFTLTSSCLNSVYEMDTGAAPGASCSECLKSPGQMKIDKKIDTLRSRRKRAEADQAMSFVTLGSAKYT